MFVQLTRDHLHRKAGQRLDVAEADAEALLHQGLAVPVLDDPLSPLVTRAVSDGLARLHGELGGMVEHALERCRGTAGPRTPVLAAGAELENAWRSFGEYAQAVKKACQTGATPDGRLLKAASGLAENVGGDGGFLVPAEFSNKIMERLYRPSSLMALCDQMTIGGNSITLKRNNETSRATGSRWGGVRAYWLDEADQHTASKPTFGTFTLKPRKLGVFVYVTDELMEDTGTALEAYLTRVAGEEIRFLVEDAVLNGTGSTRPRGILNHPALVSVAKETGQAAATVVTENLVKMWARLWTGCRDNAVWLINQDIEPQLHTLAIGVGSGGQVVYLPPGGLSAKPYATLYGRPVLPTEYSATLGTVGDILLVDPTQYLLVTRGPVRSALSMHLRFDYDEMAFKFTFRVDGDGWWSSALTPFKGSNTQSCFVALATRA